MVGSPETVRRGLEAFIAQTDADELLVTAQIFDHAARLRSFEIVGTAHDALAARQAERAVPPPEERDAERTSRLRVLLQVDGQYNDQLYSY